MEPSELQRVKQQDENRRLKPMVADQTLDIQVLKAVVGKRWYGPPRRAQRWACSDESAASVCACRLVELLTATWRYRRAADLTVAALRTQVAGAGRRAAAVRLSALAHAPGSHGVAREPQAPPPHLPCRRAAGARRRRKRRLAGDRIVLPALTARGQRWSMDFVRDKLTDGRPFCTLNIVDDL